MSIFPSSSTLLKKSKRKHSSSFKNFSEDTCLIQLGKPPILSLNEEEHTTVNFDVNPRLIGNYKHDKKHKESKKSPKLTKQKESLDFEGMIIQESKNGSIVSEHELRSREINKIRDEQSLTQKKEFTNQHYTRLVDEQCSIAEILSKPKKSSSKYINEKSNESKLTQKCKSIKHHHHYKKPSKDRNSMAHILSKHDLRFKFEELINEENEYLLPRKYKLLLKKFEAMVKNLLSQKGHQTEFGILQFELQNQGINLTFQDLEHLITIDASLFAIKLKNKKLFVELLLPKTSDVQQFISEKTQNLKEYMLNILKELHFEFLESIGMQKDYLIYESQRVWHPQFPFERVSELPFKVIDINKKTFFIRSNSKKKENSQTNITEKTQEKFRNSKLEAQIKEMVERTQTRQNKGKTKRGFKIEGNVVRTLAKMLHDYYKLRNVSNMFLANVTTHLSANSSFLSLNEREVQIYLSQLIMITEDWLEIIPSETHPILHISLNTPLSQICSKISSYFS